MSDVVDMLQSRLGGGGLLASFGSNAGPNAGPNGGAGHFGKLFGC